MWPFSQAAAAKDDPSTGVLNATVSPSSTPKHHVVQAATGGPLPHPSLHDDAPITVTGWPNERLGIPLAFRAPILLGGSFFCGFTLGSAQGGTMAGFRFRAENAHRLPTTQTGWFLYQKSKNYHVMLGGVKEGVKFGSVIIAWTTLFMATEEIMDQSRSKLFARTGEETAPGQRDAANTVIAAMTVAGAYSWKKGLDTFAAARTAKMALKYSVLYGLAQDITATLRGDRPAYISWLARKTPWPSLPAT